MLAGLTRHPMRTRYFLQRWDESIHAAEDNVDEKLNEVYPRLSKQFQSLFIKITLAVTIWYETLRKRLAFQNMKKIHRPTERERERAIFQLELLLLIILKGKFSCGIEGALASTLNRDFNWKQLSEIILCTIFYVFKVYLSNIDSEKAEIFFKGDFQFWAWAPHFIMIWNITVIYKFWRTYLFQDA